MWRFLRHPNVLPLIGALMSEDWFAMVSEWMSNGNINQFVKAHPKVNRLRLVRPPFASLHPSFRQLKSLQLEGVAKGLIYLHSNEMVHGDIKGVSFRFFESIYCLNKLTRQGKHPDRRNRSSPPGRLRSTHNRLRPYKRPILELVYPMRFSPMDESGAN